MGHCGAAARVLNFRSVDFLCGDCESSRFCLPKELCKEYRGALTEIIQHKGPYERGARVFGIGTPFSALFLVQFGAIKTQQVTVDGDVNLTGFYLPGDLFGLDAIGSDVYPCEAIALQDTRLCELPYERLEVACSGIPNLQHWLLSRLGSELKAHGVQGTWTTRKKIGTRVLSFFLDLQQRLEVRQKPKDGYYSMPMRKSDVALFLKMTPETFSRTLGVLRGGRLLDIRSNTFRLQDMEAVKRWVGE